MNTIRFRIKYLNFKAISALIVLVLALCLSLEIFIFKTTKNAYHLDYDANIYNTYSITPLYSKENSLYYINKNSTVDKLCDNFHTENFATADYGSGQTMFISTLAINNNNSFYYFVQNGTNSSETLYKYQYGKEPEKIDENVSVNIYFCNSSNKVLYFKPSNSSQEFGALYLYENGKKSKVSNDYCTANNYRFSSDGKSIAYIESDTKSLKESLYIQKIGGKKRLIDEYKHLGILELSSDASVVFYSKSQKYDDTQALYSKIKEKAPELISSKVGQYLIIPKDLSIYYVDDYSAINKSGSLCYKELGKKSTKLDSEVIGFQNSYDASKKNVLSSYVDFLNNKEITYSKKIDSATSTYYYIHNTSSPISLFSIKSDFYSGSIIRNSAESSFINITSKDGIEVTKFFLNGKKSPTKKILNGNQIYPDNNYYQDKIFFTTMTSKKAELYSYSILTNKTEELLSTPGDIRRFTLDKGILYYISKDEFWMKESYKTPVLISKATKFFIANENVYFYKQTIDSKYELYKYSLGEKPKLIDSGIELFQ